ncbi:MAG: helix-turn-helix transcriptional regulator [Planctomycetota bacterium]|jgi:predicted ArsR family transcriptional regulator
MTLPDPGPSKRRLLELLKRRGPVGAAALAAEMGLTDVAVRQHLAALHQDGLVEFRAAIVDGPPRRGRPSRAWRLTDRARVLFPDRHADLTVGLIEAVRAAFGEAGMDRIVEMRGRDQEALYRRVIPGGDVAIRERVEALARQRTEEGYMAEVRDDAASGGFLLIEHHCPVCDAARTCQGLCASELRRMQRTLGDRVRVERIEHLMAVGQRCVYRIAEVA